MNENSKELFKAYYTLRNLVDESSKNLSRIHAKHMKCAIGCDMCCMDYSIFPIEFHFILSELKESYKPQKPDSPEKEDVCVFLSGHACSIYSHRPIICRTHGIPLLFMNDDSDWELSACELNFTAYNFENFTFDNTFPQDKFNSKLYLLNKKFIAEFKEIKYAEHDLIPIKRLLDYLQ